MRTRDEIRYRVCITLAKIWLKIWTWTNEAGSRMGEKSQKWYMRAKEASERGIGDDQPGEAAGGDRETDGPAAV